MRGGSGLATETQRHRGTAVPQIKTEATEARRHGGTENAQRNGRLRLVDIPIERR